ncbi:AcrR family transcriptional regulator [Microbacterium sp. SORGH_AS 888]|nr:AcrR family transcriptional regulator [Microbacterium sp. SORGH_AS_0888]
MSQIADAARRCFARNGFAGTSMADIITESGLSAGSIYSHFPGKAELTRFTSESLLEARRASLAAMTREGAAPTPAEILVRLYDEMAGAGVTEMLVQIWAEAPHDPLLAGLARDKIAQVRELLHEALLPWAATQDGDVQRLAADATETIMLLFQGATVRQTLEPEADAHVLLAAVVRLLR